MKPALLAALVLTIALPACSKPRRVGAPPPPDPAAELEAVWDRSIVTATPRPKPGRPQRSIAEADAEARELAAEFQRESEQARRIELLYELAANGSEPAAAQLEELYQETTDIELKTHAIFALPFLQATDLSQPLRMIDDALATTQPAELRAAALATLREMDSAATVPLWRELLNDQSPEVRELAQATLDYFEAAAER